MKYFLTTPNGETGPFTPTQLNRLFMSREIQPEQLCRAEDSQEKRPLSAVFKHFAPSKEIALQARKKVSFFNVTEGSRQLQIGIVLLFVSLLRFVVFERLNSWVFIGGVIMLTSGLAQLRLGRKQVDELKDREQPPGAGADAEPPDGQKIEEPKYDY